ncbi:MAG: peptidase M48, partial [Nisaea sp.]|nr:peptidase M48 [Nisaea sp.]
RMQFLIPRQRTNALSEDLRRTTYSFRQLTDEERASARPLEIKVVTVDPGDTEPVLASGVPHPGYEVRFFRVMNGLETDGLPAPGTRVKTVGPR